jgi:hypothetical protein
MDLSQKFGLKNQLLVDLDAHIFFREWMDRLEWHASWWKVCSALPLCCERHNLNVFVLYFLTYLQTRVRGLIGTSWLGQVTSASLYCNYQNESDSRKTWVPNLPIRLNIWFFSFFLGIHWTFEFGLTDFTTKDIFRWKQRQTESPRPWPVGSWGSRLTRQPPNFIMCNKYLNCTVYCETCTIWNNGMIEMQTQTPIKIMYLWSTSTAMFSIMCALKIIKFTSFDKK